MTPNFCPRCGSSTKTIIEDPEFCSHCALPLGSDGVPPAAAPRVPTAAPAGQSGTLPATFDPYVVLEGGFSVEEAVAAVSMRCDAAGVSFPTNIGVIVEFARSIQATLPWHTPNIEQRLADPAATLPYHLAAEPLSSPPRIWRDVRGELVSRAGALAYYWAGKRQAVRWGMEPLSPTDRRRLVTTHDERLDFEMARKDADPVRVVQALLNLQDALDRGVHTKNVNIDAVGAPITGWVIFAMDELAPKYRPTGSTK